MAKELKQQSLMDEVSLECAVCLEILTDPRMLLCSHTFCCNCIQDLVKASQSTTTICCPTCRQSSAVPDEGVGKFQRNVYADMCKRLKENLSDSPARSETIAGEAKSNKYEADVVCVNWDEGGHHRSVFGNESATVFCQDCADYLCRHCQEIHPLQKVFRGHKLIPTNEITPEAVDEVRAERHKPKCKKHQQDIILYCDTCHEVICPVCCVISHKSHECRELSTVAVELKSQLQIATTPLTETVSQCEFLLDQVKERKKTATSKFEDARHKLGDSMKQVVRELQASEAAAQLEINSSETKANSDFDATTTQLYSLKERGENLQGQIHRLCTEKLSQEFKMAAQAPAVLAAIKLLKTAIPKLIDVDVDVSYADMNTDTLSSLSGQVNHKKRSLPVEALISDPHNCITFQLGAISSMVSIPSDGSLVCCSDTTFHKLEPNTGKTTTITANFGGGRNALVCAVGEQLLVASPSHPNVIILSALQNQTMNLISKCQIQGQVTGAVADYNGNALVTTMNPARITVYASSGKSLQVTQNVTLSGLDQNKLKAVESGNTFAVLAKEAPQVVTRHQRVVAATGNIYSKIVWVNRDGTVLHSFENPENSFEDITSVSQHHLLVSDSSTNSIIMFDDSGQRLCKILDNDQGIRNPRALYWDRRRHELCVETDFNIQHTTPSGIQASPNKRVLQIYQRKRADDGQLCSERTHHTVTIQLPKLGN